jgi:hypothetical protein
MRDEPFVTMLVAIEPVEVGAGRHQRIRSGAKGSNGGTGCLSDYRERPIERASVGLPTPA